MNQSVAKIKKRFITHPLIGPTAFSIYKRIRRNVPPLFMKLLKWEKLSTVTPATTYFFPLRIQNWGTTTWKAPRGQDDGIYLRYWWEAKDGIAEYEEKFLPLPYDIVPGGVINLRGIVSTPLREGRYNLSIDLHDKHNGWLFTENGKAPMEMCVQVQHSTDGEVDCSKIALWTTVDVTSRCNIRCMHCSRTILIKHELEPEKFNREITGELIGLINREILPRTWQLSLTGVGEPLMSKWTLDLLEHAHRKRIPYIDITTNATLLNKKLIDRLCYNGVTKVIISLDAASESTYERIRPGASFQGVLENIRLLSEARERLDPRMVLRFNMVIQKSNISELVDYLKLARDLGIDEVYLFHMVVHDMELFHLSLFNFKEETNRYLDKARKFAEEIGVLLSTPQNFVEAGVPVPQGPYQQWCFQPWKELLISHAGVTSPCCAWDDNSHDDIKNGFENVWNGALYRSLRQELISGKLRKTCKKCSALFGGRFQDKENFIGPLAHRITKKET